MNTKKLLVLSVLLFFLSSSILCNSFANDSQISESHQLSLNIIDNTSQKLGKKYDIHRIGHGIDGQYGYLEISFKVYRKLSKEKARHMLIECAEELLTQINSNEKIKPFLKSHPFTLKNVGIIFYICDEKNHDFPHPEIAVARWSSKGVSFKTVDKENTYRFKEVYEETHEEALNIVKKQISQRNSDE